MQRLSASVSGKAQKYSRVGPREFVNFRNRDLTIKEVKEACIEHFGTRIGENLVCDVLSGEQGPSCNSVDQIPDLKVIHVRFIHKAEGDAFARPPPKRAKYHSCLVQRGTSTTTSTSSSAPFRQPTKNLAGKCTPKSLTVSAMLKLGRVVQTTTTLVNLFSFHIETMTWSTIPVPVEFVISSHLLGEGGFRKAYKASTQTNDFAQTTWVVKKYKPEALQVIKDSGQSVEEHTKKVVQMHHLARNFAAQLHKKVMEDDLSDVFGNTLKYGNIYFGKLPDGKFVTVEELVEGTFTKHINNDGLPYGDETDELSRKAQCLSHFSFEQSNREVILVDIQGSSYNLFDPEIASAVLLGNDQEVMFTTGNLSTTAINNFIEFHVCNFFCKCLNLKPLS